MTQIIPGRDAALSSIGSSATSPQPSAAEAGDARSQQQGQAAPESSVQIGGLAARLASIEQSLRDQPAVDAARVAQLQRAIAAGTYQVNAARTATGLLSTEQALAAL